jgi:hypothetical protein
MSDTDLIKHKDGPEGKSFGDLNHELRLLLNGAQVLTAFLMILPFSAGFDKISDSEKWVYGLMFVCSLASLVLFTAPAAQHRIERPLRDRVEFKRSATKFTIAGLVPMSLAWVLAAHFVVTQVLGATIGTIVAVVAAIGIVAVWWVLPITKRDTA